MESFEIYYEKFVFKTPEFIMNALYKLGYKEKEIKEYARKQANQKIKETKALLKEMGYTLKRDDYSYHLRPTKTIALGRDDIHDKNIVGKYSKHSYVRALFTLAHEAGHALQFNPDNDETYLLDGAVDRLKTAKSKEELDHLQNVNNVWYEIDAWERGLQFIPDEFKDEYKKYARSYYTSYMRGPSYGYSRYPEIHQLLINLAVRK